jgi:2'-5' RNA ligase superfamily
MKVVIQRFLILSGCYSLVVCLQLNIHLPLVRVNNSWAFDKCPYNAALEANLALRQESETEQIDFFSHHTPHLTLFLSDFDTRDKDEPLIIMEIVQILREVVSNHSQVMCQISWPITSHVGGPYSMYPIHRTKCLQNLSDKIVLALNPFILKPQPIPDWVYRLPFWIRFKKLFMIARYGSPNVLSEYDPHVTVGYDEVTSVQSRKDILNSMFSHDLECSGLISHVAIARVGVGGSVLQSEILALIPLQEPVETDLTSL